MSAQPLFDFSPDCNLSNWRIVDDVVMGGRSSGNFRLNEEGHAVFSGKVSLENNGGFSSVRYIFPESLKITEASERVIHIRLKGDGKKYQFRVKEGMRQYHSYIKEFETSGEWEEVRIPLKEMYASFRGRKLDMPNFSHEVIEEMRFLIANKKAETFSLTIDKIELR
ncbi:MAG: CIA30 family protein [Bacteroidota bacterium]